MKIAVDLDGTLAEYHGWKGEDHIGAPISLMVSRVKQWLEEDHEVVIFTARVNSPYDSLRIPVIREWLDSAGLPRNLEITNIKQRDFDVIYDDRCIQVEPNTGAIVTEKAREMAYTLWADLRRCFIIRDLKHMGYCTRYKLEIKKTNGSRLNDDELLAHLYKELRDSNEWADTAFEEPCKWYEHEKDMRAFSAAHPDFLFELKGEGEGSQDIWTKYFVAGKCQVAKARIQCDPFDPTKLV